MQSPNVLILGGTAEARALASSLAAAGVAVTSSLAGRVAEPALPVGNVRIGGFGGVAGLAEYLHPAGISLVVDATYPFAVTMSASAVTACGRTGTPLLRLARPGWSDHPDAKTWNWVDTHPDDGKTVWFEIDVSTATDEVHHQNTTGQNTTGQNTTGQNTTGQDTTG